MKATSILTVVVTLIASFACSSQVFALSCAAPRSALHMVGVTHPLRARGFAIVLPGGTEYTDIHELGGIAGHEPKGSKVDMTAPEVGYWEDAELTRAANDGAFERVPFDIEVADEWTVLIVPKEPLAVGQRYRLHYPKSRWGGDEPEVMFETTIEQFEGFEPILDLDLMDVRHKEVYPFGDIRYVDAHVVLAAQWYRALRVEFVVDGEPFRPPSLCPDGLHQAGADLTKTQEMLFTSITHPKGTGDLEPTAHSVFARLILPGSGVVFETQKEVFTLAQPEERPSAVQTGCTSAPHGAPIPTSLLLLLLGYLVRCGVRTRL